MPTLLKEVQITIAKKDYSAICRERVVKNGHIDEIEISDIELEQILSDFETALISKSYETKSEFQDCLV